MSTANPADLPREYHLTNAPAPPPGTAVPVVATVPVPAPPVPDVAIRVFGHSNLFYWWPVWFVCFLFAGLTYWDGHRMAIVPAGTTVEQGATVQGEGGPRDVLVAPPQAPIPPLPGKQVAGQPPQARLRVAANNTYGVIFVGTLLFVIAVTNYTVRGLASLVTISILVIVGLLLALFHVWDDVLAWLGGLDIRMNAEGYLALGIPLLLLWLFTTFIYDHYTYLVVTRGQIQIRQSIGDSEVAVDSSGLVLDKKRNDFFRHWLLGFGAGDLHVKTAGAEKIDFELQNVLGITWKINRIQDIVREKEVAAQAPGG